MTRCTSLTTVPQPTAMRLATACACAPALAPFTTPTHPTNASIRRAASPCSSLVATSPSTAPAGTPQSAGASATPQTPPDSSLSRRVSAAEEHLAWLRGSPQDSWQSSPMTNPSTVAAEDVASPTLEAASVPTKPSAAMAPPLPSPAAKGIAPAGPSAAKRSDSPATLRREEDVPAAAAAPRGRPTPRSLQGEFVREGIFTLFRRASPAPRAWAPASHARESACNVANPSTMSFVPQRPPSSEWPHHGTAAKAPLWPPTPSSTSSPDDVPLAAEPTGVRDSVSMRQSASGGLVSWEVIS